MPDVTDSARRTGEPVGKGRELSTTLMKEFFRKSIVITVLLSIILSLSIPAVLYFFEILRYKEESIYLITNFVAQELEDSPWAQLEDPEKMKRLSARIAAFMELSNLIEFKIWRSDGVLFYSFHNPNSARKSYPKNPDLQEALERGAPSAEVVDPSEKSESAMLAEHGKLFEIYVPIEKGGKVLGAVEIYRTSPPYRVFGGHTFYIVLVSVTLFVLLYAFMHGTFKRTSQKIIDYDRKLGTAYLLLGRSYFDTVSSLIKALEMRDMETEGHSQRVVALSLYFGEKMALDAQERQKLLLGAYLHDIGKIGIPDSILLKKGRLTDDERQLMMTHVIKGYDVIRDVETLKLASDVILFHHEKWNGSGYDQGMKGEEIPVVARIFALVDVFDALRNKRPYKDALSFHDAREIINEDSGSHFDPRLVAVFNSMTEDEIERVVSRESLMNISAMVKNSFQAGL